MKRNERRKSKTRTPGTKSPSPTKTIPTPLELDRFIPWELKNLQSAQTVVVKKVYQEEYSRGRNSRFASSSRISRSSVSIRQTESYPMLATVVPTIAFGCKTENAIQLIIFYNRSGHIVEIAIHCSFPIDRKIIEVISLALPYHKQLTKLTCKGEALDNNILYEVAKILPVSNLTDICLDNTFVPQGTYYILLDNLGLRCLSLSKCKINDTVCQKIAERLKCIGSASKNLRMLSLSCNLITDIGAKALGHSLRTNRHIVHLNLCGNIITSVGAGYLLEPLSEFSLSTEEIKEMVRRRRDFYYKKAAVPKSQTSIFTNLSNDMGNSQSDKETSQKKSSFDSKSVSPNVTEKVGVEDFSDPTNTVYKNGRWFSIGNFTLCSLNLGYNSLDYTSLSKVVNVLSYQRDQTRCSRCTGLLRIVIEGNPLPFDCEEYSKIKIYLGILNNEAWSYKKNRKSSSSTKTRRDTSVRKASSSIVLMA